MSYWDDYDDVVKTPSGVKALQKLKDADTLHEDACRIQWAVTQGLLPGVTAEQASNIELEVSRLAHEAAQELDRAEGFAP